MLSRTSLTALLHVSIARRTLWTVFLTLIIGFGATMGGQHIQQSFAAQLKNVQRGQELAELNSSRSRLSDFPPLRCTIQPFGFTPNYGAMTSAAQLSRTFCQVKPDEFVAVPAYDPSVFTQPLAHLNQGLHSAANQEALTTKLFYSTRYLGSYDLDSPEFASLSHPAIDYKMPTGTPVSAIADGRVHNIFDDPEGLGHTVVIEHRLVETGERIFSVYGHLDSSIVSIGDDIAPGQVIGFVGMTGDATGPHLHLQIDRDDGRKIHAPYAAPTDATRLDVTRWTINPIDFIRQH